MLISNLRTISFIILFISTFQICKGQEAEKVLKQKLYFCNGKNFKAEHYNSSGKMLMEWNNNSDIINDVKENVTFYSFENLINKSIITTFEGKLNDKGEMKFFKRSTLPVGHQIIYNFDSTVNEPFYRYFTFNFKTFKKKHTISELQNAELIFTLGSSVIHAGTSRFSNEPIENLIDSTLDCKLYLYKNGNHIGFRRLDFDSLLILKKEHLEYSIPDGRKYALTVEFGINSKFVSRSITNLIQEGSIPNLTFQKFYFNDKKKRIKYTESKKNKKRKEIITLNVEYEYFSDTNEKWHVTNGKKKKYLVEVVNTYW
jgi:hypothetical protein